jgi:hypothetical protein
MPFIPAKIFRLEKLISKLLKDLKFMRCNLVAKAGCLDHIWPVKLQLTYIT